ncbi:MAG: hypothetical protein WC791_04555 [Candidatus Paceibacterota bacterium]
MEKQKEHWLKQILLDFQSGEQAQIQKARSKICGMTGASKPEVLHLGDALGLVYMNYCNGDEREVFLHELEELIRFSKKNEFSLETMETLIRIASCIGKLSFLSEAFAHTFVLCWRNAGERNTLAPAFLSACGNLGESMPVYKAVSFLCEHKWIPRKYALGACCVLLETNPLRWFNTMARMFPVITRYKNKLIREDGVLGMETWAVLEECLQFKMAELGPFRPFDKGNDIDDM